MCQDIVRPQKHLKLEEQGTIVRARRPHITKVHVDKNKIQQRVYLMQQQYTPVRNATETCTCSVGYREAISCLLKCFG